MHSYYKEGRGVSISLFFTLPLFLLYELGILLSGTEFRNAAEVILKGLRSAIGQEGIRFLHWFILTLIVICCVRVVQKDRPVLAYFGLVLLESLVLAMAVGPLLALSVNTMLLDHPLTAGEPAELSSRLLLSIGAGVYEELLFRFLILGGLFLLCFRVFRAPWGYSVLIAVSISAFLFAVYHHMGSFGPRLEAYPLIFRFFAGTVLGTVFIYRGFGVAVYLHVFYDILRDVEAWLNSG